MCVSSPDLYVEILTYKVQVLKVGAVGSAQIMRVGFIPYDRRGPCSPTMRGHSQKSPALTAGCQHGALVLAFQPPGL